MDTSCAAIPCPVILNATCVFYEGNNLVYTGINSGDNLQTALQKIDAKFEDAGLGYVFVNGIIQTAPGVPVGLGGSLTHDTTIGGNYTLTFAGNLKATKLITTGGTSSQFVKGDGSLDNGPYQPSGNYISSLTGDGTATGPGSAVFTLATVNADIGTFGSSTRVPVITVNGKGLITGITTTLITVPSGVLIFTGDVTGSGLTGSPVTLTLNPVNADVYGPNTFLKFAVNAKGLVTSATLVTAFDIMGALGYTPVPTTRTISINGVTRDLSTNRTWSVGSVTNVSVVAGTGIAASVADPTNAPIITITNTAPDQIVSITNGPNISVTGSYPNFTIAATAGYGTVTSVGMTVPTGLTITGSPITVSGTLGLGLDSGYSIPTISNQSNWNTAYNHSIVSAIVTGTANKTLTLTQQDAGTISASWTDYGLTSVGVSMPSAFNVSNSPLTSDGTISITGAGTTAQYIRGDGSLATFPSIAGYVTSVTASSPILSSGGTTPNISIPAATTSVDGYLTSIDWNTFNNKSNTVGTVTSVAALTLDTVGTDLSSTVANGTTTPVITLSVPTASASNRGALSSADWITFNSKEPAIASGTTSEYWRGDKSFQTLNTSVVPELTNLYFTNARAISSTLTGYISSAGIISSADSILSAIQKLNGNISGLTTGVSSVFGRTGAVIATEGDYSLTQLSDVTIATPLSGQVLRYSGSSWVNSTETYVGTVTSVAALTLGTTGTDLSSSVADSTTTPVITLNVPDASAINRGALTSADWSIFNNKQDIISTNSPITLTGTAVGITQSSTSTDGYLSSTDWNTFDGKQPQLNGTGFVKASGTTISYDNSTYLTTISGITAGGELSGTYPNPTLLNSAVIGKVLTGLNVTGGSIAATDDILVAFGKVQNQINGLVGGLIYQGTWDANTNTPTLTSSVGIKGHFYIVSVAGTTNLNGNNNWHIGDWAVFDGSIWGLIDNTDSVTSVNGYIGAVSLTTADIPEVTNLYYTDTRARNAISGGTGISYAPSTGIITNSAPDQTVILSNGTAISITGTYPSFTINNTAPDQTVVLSNGTGISVTGSYPSFTITNTAPDQIVSLTGGGTTTISGTYPSFTITSNDAYTGTVTSVGLTSGTGISIGGSTSPITTSGSFTVTNTAPDQVVALTNGTGISISGTYPNFTITNTSPSSGGTVTSVAALTLGTSGTDLSSTVANGTTTPVITLNVPTASATNRGALSSTDWTTFNSKESVLTFSSPLVRTTNTISIPVATTSVNGYLSSTDWTTFNNKQATISLTTTGTSGAATFISNTLNIPQYQAAGTYVTSVTGTSPIVSSGGTTPAISIPAATNSVNGYLSSTDWNTFNNKANALSGTTNTLPKFTSASSIGDSNVKDNGNVVSINTTAGGFGALQVGNYNGSILMNTTDASGGLIFQNTSSGNKLWDFSSYGNDINFNESGVATPVMTLKSGGNIGIKQVNPAYLLDVNGTFHATGAAIFGSTLSDGVNVYTLPSSTGTLALTSALSGYVPTSRTLTINGTTYDLSANRSWTINSMVYPSAGIAVSTGSAWGTSITDNSANWNTAYTNRITSLTTTGTSGAATLIANVLNIPNYSTDLSGYVPYTGATTNVNLGSFNLTSTNVTANGNITLYGNLTGTKTVSSGSPYSLTVTQNSTNATDTGDGAITISHILSGIGTGTELVTRSFIFSSDNQRTGGSVLSNSRVLYLVSSTQSGTTTTNLDQVYIEGGAMIGTVTNNRGVLVKTMQGTNQAAFVATGLTSSNRVHLLLGNYTLPTGAWGIYSGLSDASYLQGSLLLGSATDDGVNKLQVTGAAKVTGQLTLGSTITNGTYTYTLPGATGTIALVGGVGVGTVTSVAALTLGTTGTDLNSSVATGTTTPVITLNVPTASAANRGVLSSTDWSTFNGKESALTFSAPLVRTTNTISIPVATTSVNGYLSSTDWTTFNNKQSTITLTTTGTSGAATFSANTLNVPNYGSALSGYLPLTGGTLTGDLSIAYTTANLRLFLNNTTATTGRSWYLNSYSNGSLYIGNATAGDIFNFSSTGVATFSAALGGTSATFSGLVSGNGFVNGTSGTYKVVTNTSATLGYLIRSGTWKGSTENNLSLAAETGFGITFFTDGSPTERLTIASTGSATFTNFVQSNANFISNITTDTPTVGTSNATYNYTGYSGYWGLRTTTTGNNFALDTYNGGTPKNVLTITQAGAATFSSSVTATNGIFTGSGIQIASNSAGSNSTFTFNYTANAASRTWRFANDYTAYGDFKLQQSTTQTGSTFADILAFSSTGAATFSSSVTTGGSLDVTGTGNVITIRKASNIPAIAWVGATYTAIIEGGDYFNFYTGGTGGRLYITSGGDIGIGITTPLQTTANRTVLTVNGTNQSIINLGSGGILRGYFYGDSTSAELYSAAQLNLLAAGANPMLFYTNGTERMRIFSGGNIAIGTTTDSGYKLDVNGTGRFSSSVTANGDIVANSGSSTAVYVYNASSIRGKLSMTGNEGDLTLYGSSATAKIYLSAYYASYFNSGNVLIGTTTDSGYKLDVSGTVRFSSSLTGTSASFSSTLSSAGFTATTGSFSSNLTVTGASTVTFSPLVGTGSRTVLASSTGVLSAPVSDSTVKENIQPLDYGIADIMKLKPISFEYIEEYKDYGEGKQIGNIAQDMAEVIPEAVFTTPSTGKMGINYDQLNGIYIKALQELQEQIKELQSQIKK